MHRWRTVLLVALAGMLLGVLLWRWLGGDGDTSHIAPPLDAHWSAIQDRPVEARPAALIEWVNTIGARDARASVYSLADALGPRARPYLRAVAGEDGVDPAVRAAALGALGVCGERAQDASWALEVFEEAEAEPVRVAAARLIGQWRWWDAMPVLIAAMRDPAPPIRAAAWSAVKRIIGTDYRFDAHAPEAQRERVVQRLESEWRGYEPAHRLHLERLQESRP